MRRRPSPNHDARPAGRAIDMLILHYTGMATGKAALERLCDPAARVSAHYLIEEDGTLWHLVDEGRRAWHAGVSRWAGDSDINSRSIGVELVNPGHEFGYRPFPDAQMRAVIALCRAVLARHPIPARHVLGHSDVAPARKQDPGELFDWRLLAAAGIGLWPDLADPGPGTPAATCPGGRLRRFGYAVEDPAAALQAFHRHWSPARLGRPADAHSLALLDWLIATAGRAGADPSACAPLPDRR